MTTIQTSKEVNMKHQRGFISTNALVELFSKGVIVVLVVVFCLGYVVIRGCEYVVTNYAIEVKAK